MLSKSQLLDTINKIKENKIYLIAIPFGLILFFLIAILIISSNSQPKGNNSLTPAPNQTVTDPGKLGINAISPGNSTTNAGIYQPVTVTFSQPVSSPNNILLTLSPTSKGTSSWSADNTTLTFTPSEPLRTNSQYTATVTYNGMNYTWSFTVVSDGNVSQEDIQKEQSQGDENFANWWNDVTTKYPWFEKLPLQTDNYFAYFDVERKTFVGKLYPKTSGPTSVDDQVNSMKGEIMTALTNLGINTAQFPMDWQITPEP